MNLEKKVNDYRQLLVGKQIAINNLSNYIDDTGIDELGDEYIFSGKEEGQFCGSYSIATDECDTYINIEYVSCGEPIFDGKKLDRNKTVVKITAVEIV